MPRPAGTFIERLASKLISEEGPRQDSPRRRARGLRVVGWCTGPRPGLKRAREKVAQYFLEQAGYEVYLPKIRQRRHHKGRRIEVLSPLFPGYLFTRIELRWRGVRLCPGVIKLVMTGDEPSRVPTGSSPRSGRAIARCSFMC